MGNQGAAQPSKRGRRTASVESAPVDIAREAAASNGHDENAVIPQASL